LGKANKKFNKEKFILSIIGDIDTEFEKYKAENDKYLSGLYFIFKGLNENFYRLRITREDLIPTEGKNINIYTGIHTHANFNNSIGSNWFLSGNSPFQNSNKSDQNIKLKELPDDFEQKQSEIWEKVLIYNWYIFNLETICNYKLNKSQISELEHPVNQKFHHRNFNIYLQDWLVIFIKAPETEINNLNRGSDLYNKYLKKSIFIEKEKSKKLHKGRQVPKGKINEDLKNHFVKVLFQVKEFPTNNQLSDENILGQSGWKHKMNNQDFVSELSLFLIKVKKSKKYTINSEREELLNKTMEDLSKKLIRLQQIETNYKTKEHKDFNNSEKGTRESDY